LQVPKSVLRDAEMPEMHRIEASAQKSDFHRAESL
jgi:hypothetical protein